MKIRCSYLYIFDITDKIVFNKRHLKIYSSFFSFNHCCVLTVQILQNSLCVTTRDHCNYLTFITVHVYRSSPKHDCFGNSSLAYGLVDHISKYITELFNLMPWHTERQSIVLLLQLKQYLKRFYDTWQQKPYLY